MALLRDIIMDKAQPYANHDLSTRVRLTCSPGVLYPLYVQEVLPGDTFHIRSHASVQTYPLLAPLMGSFRLQLSWFFVPTRLYTQSMDVNRLMFDPKNTPFPTFNIPAQFSLASGSGFYKSGISSRSFYGVVPGTFLDYMGFGVRTGNTAFMLPSGTASTITLSSAPPRYNATPLVGFWDIYRNYFVNTQEDGFPMFDPAVITESTSGTGTRYIVRSVPNVHTLKYLDDFIYSFVQNEGQDFNQAWLRAFSTAASPVVSSLMFSQYAQSSFTNDGFQITPTFGLLDRSLWPESDSDFGANVSFVDASVNNMRNCGLPFVTHRPDLFTAFLNEATYGDMVESSQINVQNNTITVNQIRMANHLLKYDERGLVSGGRLSDWVYAEYGVKTSHNLCIPQLLGVSSSALVFNEVVSNSNVESDIVTQSGLGGLSGRGVGFLNGYRQSFHSSEFGYLIACFTIVPNVSYDQGTKPLYFKTEFEDLYAPELARLGFQTLPAPWFTNSVIWTMPTSVVHQYPKPAFLNPSLGTVSGTGTTSWSYTSLSQGRGYQPAWQEYMTDVDTVHGDLVYGGELDYWAITRRFGIPLDALSFGGPVSSTTSFWNSMSYTSYVLPWQFNYGFVNKSLDAQNFICEFSLDVLAKRQIGKRVMPTL